MLIPSVPKRNLVISVYRVCSGHYLERVKYTVHTQPTLSVAAVSVVAVWSVAETVLVERTKNTAEKPCRVEHGGERRETVKLNFDPTRADSAYLLQRVREEWPIMMQFLLLEKAKRCRN